MKYISVTDLQKLRDESSVVIIDIREIDEHKVEHIPGSKCIPASKISQLKSLVGNEKGPFVFYCQAGNRTKQLETSIENIISSNSYILEGGLNNWVQQNGDVKVNKSAPLPIMRQVQIIAGILILIGVILGFLISPLFNILSGFVGLGLLFAGITGFCGMANLLMLLPYNK